MDAKSIPVRKYRLVTKHMKFGRDIIVNITVQPLLKAVNVKSCDDQYSQNVIKNGIKYCKNHEEKKQKDEDIDIMMRKDLDENDERVMSDENDGKSDVREYLRHYDINDKIIIGEQKEEAAKMLAKRCITATSGSFTSKESDATTIDLFS